MPVRSPASTAGFFGGVCALIHPWQSAVWSSRGTNTQVGGAQASQTRGVDGHAEGISPATVIAAARVEAVRTAR